MELRAILVDFDGFIIETDELEMQSWAIVFGKYGAVLDTVSWMDTVGVSADDPFSDLENQLGLAVDRHHVKMSQTEIFNNLLSQEPVSPGVVDLLSWARERELLVGLASSNQTSWLTAQLERLSLNHYFDVICGADLATGASKPAPDVYLVALDRLGISALNAVAFEDSPNGVTAAKSAGLRCIAVPSRLCRSRDFSHADLVIPSLAPFDPVGLGLSSSTNADVEN